MLIALVLLWVAVVGIIGYLWHDYRWSKEAGKVVQRARETLAPTEWPRRRK